MSQPGNGSWNDPQSGGSLGQNYGQQDWSQQGGQSGQQGSQDWSQQGQQSGGQQDWSQQGSESAQQGSQDWSQQGGQQDWNQQGQQAAYGQGQGGQGSQAAYGGQQFGNQPYGAPAKSGGVGEVFGDSKFAKSLTPGIAGITYLVIVAATALWALTDIIYGFTGLGGDSGVRLKMNTFAAVLNLLTDLAIVAAVALGLRVLLELCVNVAKREHKD